MTDEPATPLASDDDCPAGPPSARHVLILGTADWDALIATNQHSVTEVLAEGASVYFVESLALRRPRFNRQDVARIAARLRRSRSSGVARAGSRSIPPGTRIVSPIIVPLHNRWTRKINSLLLRRAVSPWLNASGARTLYSFTPTTYGLETVADQVIYHCVDLLAAVPGISEHVVRAGEQALSAHGATAIASSRGVEEHLKARGFVNVLLMPNVADVQHFACAARQVSRTRQVVFAGNLVGFKVDFELLEEIAKALPRPADLVLAGPSTGGSTGDRVAVASLLALGVTYVGSLNRDDLAALLASCSVGLIPYLLNDYTSGVSPLKCYEYLAAGLQVVSTPLPEMTVVADSLHVVVKPRSDFVTAVLRAVKDLPVPREVERRQSLAAAHSWADRAVRLRALVLSGSE